MCNLITVSLSVVFPKIRTDKRRKVRDCSDNSFRPDFCGSEHNLPKDARHLENNRQSCLSWEQAV